MANVSRQVVLAARPKGLPQLTDFRVEAQPLPRPADGELLVRNIYMSVDPYMRGRMNDFRKSYVPPFELGQPLDGGAVGVVVESRSPGFAAGDCVEHGLGWREYCALPGRAARRVDAAAAPLSNYLGVLGMPGLTAYAGLLEIGQPKAGETVFVSAATGAVGSVVGQIAKLKGCRVAGAAGTDAKVAQLTGELGFDAAFNYRSGKLHEALGRACPAGIDVDFENVGGELLEAVLGQVNRNARIVLCGLISAYNDERPRPGPSNLGSMIINRVTMRGFIVTDFAHLGARFHADMHGWLASGAVKARETVVEGIENAPAAFLDLLGGAHIGKMLVRLAPEPTRR
jgi:NADPH-dependent curcumin reductase CurA